MALVKRHSQWDGPSPFVVRQAAGEAVSSREPREGPVLESSLNGGVRAGPDTFRAQRTFSHCVPRPAMVPPHLLRPEWQASLGPQRRPPPADADQWVLREIATSRLCGSGVEFGGGTHPLPVPLGCEVKFADIPPLPLLPPPTHRHTHIRPLHLPPLHRTPPP